MCGNDIYIYILIWKKSILKNIKSWLGSGGAHL